MPVCDVLCLRLYLENGASALFQLLILSGRRHGAMLRTNTAVDVHHLTMSRARSHTMQYWSVSEALPCCFPISASLQ